MKQKYEYYFVILQRALASVWKVSTAFLVFGLPFLSPLYSLFWPILAVFSFSKVLSSF